MLFGSASAVRIHPLKRRNIENIEEVFLTLTIFFQGTENSGNPLEKMVSCDYNFWLSCNLANSSPLSYLRDKFPLFPFHEEARLAMDTIKTFVDLAA